jgi:hypothetical protein
MVWQRCRCRRNIAILYEVECKVRNFVFKARRGVWFKRGWSKVVVAQQLKRHEIVG